MISTANVESSDEALGLSDSLVHGTHHSSSGEKAPCR
jgi:hypothetical protein